ncbi:hypothetical protein [Comamonas thiooxydans]|uniref:hypothetical protein n=1 Tax=Comamonas thiooxydans TaxID=363952 RepID=UPI0011851850|nr:hypothetical protein [Comamonas thiooxydans]
MPKRLPSLKTLSSVFDDAQRARAILEMTRTQLLEIAACQKRDAECFHPPKTHELRMTALNALESGFFGVESVRSTNDEYADYLNTGDTYAATLIRFRGNYRVQSLGDFVERGKSQGIRFH